MGRDYSSILYFLIITTFREALKERTRERVPLDWAGTQNNLGTALWDLGERENGTAKLEEAVTAFSEVLGVYQAAKADYYIQVVSQNLARAEALLAKRRGEGK